MLWNGNGCGKNKSNENFKTTIPSKKYDRPKQLEKVASLKYVGQLISNVQSEIFCQRSKVAMRAQCPSSHNPPAQRCEVSFLSLHRF